MGSVENILKAFIYDCIEEYINKMLNGDKIVLLSSLEEFKDSFTKECDRRYKFSEGYEQFMLKQKEVERIENELSDIKERLNEESI